MSYKYKDKIKDALLVVDEQFGVNDLEDVDRELDETYAKAQVFDEIFKLYIGYEDGWMSFPRGHKSFNRAVIDACKKYERSNSEC